jgi:AraC-like DNA-binding protein
MSADLIFLATSRVDQHRLHLDKYLNGYATIQFSPTGGLEVAYDDEWFSLGAGAWFWPAHSGERIRFRPSPEYSHWAHRHVGFRGTLVEKWRDEGWWLPRPQRAPDTHTPREWDEFFDELIALAQRNDTRGRMRAINRLEGLLLELADARAVQSASAGRESWLMQVVEKITVHADARNAASNSAPNYAEIAASVGMSEATLRRRFKRAMSTSPHAYVLQSRAAAARTLLNETDLPLKTIAARLGYENEYFFSRQFRELVGVAPGIYRKSRLTKIA